MIPRMPTRPLLVFSVCGQQYALPIEEVVEVSAMMATTELSTEHHPAVHGLVVRRGQPLLLLDLRVVFGCEAGVDLSTFFVVLQYERGQIGVIVDHVRGVMYIADGQDMTETERPHFVRGVIAHEGVLIQRLDMRPILAHTLPEDVEIKDTNHAEHTP